MNVVSLFSGIGGLDKGFSASGFNVIWANDFDKYAVETYRRNYDNEIVHGDINQIPFNQIPDFEDLTQYFFHLNSLPMMKKKGILHMFVVHPCTLNKKALSNLFFKSTFAFMRLV